MVKIKDEQTVKYEYVSMYEMMQHIKTMSDSGFVLVNVAPLTHQAEYKKDLA